MSRWLSRLFDKLLKLLFGDDIFISYSRADGATYAAGLADKLALRGFSCRLDQWGTESGREMPESLKKALRRSAALVLVGTKGAAQSRHVGDEVREIKRMKRMIIPVVFDGVLLKNGYAPVNGALVHIETPDVGDAQATASAEALWAAEIEGLPVSCERREVLTTGEPSEAILNRIEKTCTFWKKDKRLRAASSAATVLLIILLGASVWAGSVAAAKATEARQKTAEADAAEGRAREQQAIAEKKTQEALAATAQAAQADKKAQAAEQVASDKTKLADQAAKRAEEQTQRAALATTRAREASIEAAKQQGIAVGRQTAASADARRAQSARLDTGWADMLRYSTLLSLEAEKRLSNLGIPPAEAQESLRDSLNLLPREVVPLNFDHKLKSARLTPDGRYLITEEDDGFVRVRETNSRRNVASVKAEGGVGFSPDFRVGFLVEKASISILQLPDFRVTRKIPVSGVSSVKFSADGKYLAAEVPASAEKPNGDQSAIIFILDAQDGRQLSSIKIKDQLSDFALSDNHDLLSVSVVRRPARKDGESTQDNNSQSANYIQFWPTEGTPDAPLREFNVPLKEGDSDRVHEPISMLSFSPDGKLVAGSTSYHAVVMNTKTGELVRIAGPDHDPQEAVGSNIEGIDYVGFSPDSRSLGIMGDDATMQTWDARTGERIYGDVVSQVHVSGAFDGPYFSTSDSDGGLRVIDVRTGKESARVVTRGDAKEFAYAPEGGRIVLYEQGGQQAWIYDLASAQQSASLSSRHGLGVDQSPDGHFVAFDDKRTIVVWDAVNAREVARIECADTTFGNIRFSSGSKYVAAAVTDNTVHVWETTTGRELLSLKDIPIKAGGDDDAAWNISRLDFSPGEKFFILETKQPATTRVWDISTQRKVFSAEGVGPFSFDDRFVVLSDDTGARVIATANGVQLANFPKEKKSGLIEFSPDNKLMAVGRGKTVEVSEIEGGRPPYKKTVADEYPRYHFSPDGKFLAIASGDGHKYCQIFKAETGESVSTLPLRKDFDSFDFSPDGKFIRTFTWTKEESMRGEVEIWEVTTGHRVINCRGVRDSLRVIFSADERRVAIVDANTQAIRVFDLDTGQQEAELLQDRGVDEQLFSDDGKLLAVQSGDRVTVWEVSNWREIARLKHKGEVKSVNFTDSDGQITTVSENLTDSKVTAQVWITSEKELQRHTCEDVGRNLNLKEWQYNFGREKYGPTCPGLSSTADTEKSDNRRSGR